MISLSGGREGREVELKPCNSFEGMGMGSDSVGRLEL
jgi:hypothetical protein